MLQMLLGSIDCPGGFRYSRRFRGPVRRRSTGRQADQIAANTPMAGPPGFVTGPEDLLIDDEGRPTRIDKAYSWEAPVAAHGLMHMVLHNAWAGDPIRSTRLYVHGQYELEFGHERATTLRYLTDQTPMAATRSAHHLLRRLLFGDGRLCRFDPARHHLSGALDCVSLLDRPIVTPTAPPTPFANRVAAGPRVRRFRGAAGPGRALGAAGPDRGRW